MQWTELRRRWAAIVVVPRRVVAAVDGLTGTRAIRQWVVIMLRRAPCHCRRSPEPHSSLTARVDERRCVAPAAVAPLNASKWEVEWRSRYGRKWTVRGGLLVSRTAMGW